MAEDVLIPFGTYQVVIGDGGKGVYNANGQNGQNSSFFNDVAIGGGGSYPNIANNGGSGGGSGHQNNIRNSNQIPSIHGQSYGNKGGKDYTIIGGCEYFNGGAGGSGEGGRTSPYNTGGNGGPGIQWIDGHYYGGGGGSVFSNGKAGNGGGGGGNAYRPSSHCANGGTFGFGLTGGTNGTIETANLNFQGGNGAPNSGGGGGGSAQYLAGYSYSKGGDGGSGIVIIRYLYQDDFSCDFTIKKSNILGFFLISLIL